MTPVIRLWAGAAVASLLALSFGMDFYTYARSAALQPDPYAINDQLRRFEAARSAIPPTEVIGYASDQGLESSQGPAMYFSAQYALAPRLLRLDWRHPQVRTVVGNFATPQGLASFDSKELQLVQDFGSGVLLFRKRPE